MIKVQYGQDETYRLMYRNDQSSKLYSPHIETKLLQLCVGEQCNSIVGRSYGLRGQWYGLSKLYVKRVEHKWVGELVGHLK